MRFGVFHTTVCTMVVASSGVLAWGSQSHAQTAPSRTLPDTIAPQIQTAEGNIALPRLNVSAAPQGADAFSVRVAQIVIQNADGAHETAIKTLTTAYEGRTLKVSEIYELATRIEALYASEGRILTRAIVPPQSLRDGGTVYITIVDGYIESIDDSQLPNSVRGPVRERLSGLINRPGLTLAQIERRVLLAGRVPGLQLRTALIAGEQPGGAKLVLQAAYDAVSASIGVDNSLSDSFNNLNIEGRLIGNSVLGTGEQIYAFVATGDDFKLFDSNPMRRVIGLGLMAPLGANGLTAQVEYVGADTQPQTPSNVLRTQGEYDRFMARLSYPLVLRRHQALNLTGGFEWIEESQSAPDFGLTLSEDRLRVFNIGLGGFKALSNRTTAMGQIDLHQGVAGLGARRPATAKASRIPLSRQGSHPDFTRLTATARFNHKLTQVVSAQMVLRGQTGFGNVMPNAMQFSLDGNEAVSGFDAGAFNADSGLSARFELSTLLPFGHGFIIQPYAFAGAAKGWLEQPTALEQAKPDAWSAGAGARMALTHRASLSTELAHASTNVFAKDETRLTASVNFAF